MDPCINYFSHHISLTLEKLNSQFYRYVILRMGIITNLTHLLPIPIYTSLQSQKIENLIKLSQIYNNER